MPLCTLTGQPFEVTAEETALRKKLGIEGDPTLHPVARFMQLAAFWQHWNLHKRKCDKTGKSIVSVYPEDCPFPVWHREEWIKDAAPPSAEIHLEEPLFPQLWGLFRRCPIPHTIFGSENINCEYTDDWWHGKNCYLCHSGAECEDLRYCYRVVKLWDCQYCVFSFESERCRDLINCHGCTNVRFAFNCWQCSDSSFLYDCRNCHHCMFCSNLRNKSYCFENRQLAKEEYERAAAAWNLSSRETYARAEQAFAAMMRERAWHRALFIDRSEGSSGNYLDECKNCTNSFFLSNGAEDFCNVLRGGIATRDCLDCVGSAFNTELTYCSVNPQDHCYDIRFCNDVIRCKWMEYSMHCFQCEHCFGCCGLVGRKFHIFNKAYEPEEYERKKEEVIARMRQAGEYGRFFPGHFAATSYDESLAGFHWPLPTDTAQQFGFRVREKERERPEGSLDASLVPATLGDATDTSITQTVYWDDVERRPFRIDAADITFTEEVQVPLPSTYYARRLQDNFRRIPFDGVLRQSTCGKCAKAVQTSWPGAYDGRILCEECYLKEVY